MTNITLMAFIDYDTLIALIIIILYAYILLYPYYLLKSKNKLNNIYMYV